MCDSASEKCQQEKRKTVNGEDILFAMTSLGFENYAEALKIYLARYRDVSPLATMTYSPPTRCMYADAIAPVPSRIAATVAIVRRRSQDTDQAPARRSQDHRMLARQRSPNSSSIHSRTIR